MNSDECVCSRKATNLNKHVKLTAEHNLIIHVVDPSLQNVNFHFANVKHFFDDDDDDDEVMMKNANLKFIMCARMCDERKS